MPAASGEQMPDRWAVPMKGPGRPGCPHSCAAAQPGLRTLFLPSGLQESALQFPERAVPKHRAITQKVKNELEV